MIPISTNTKEESYSYLFSLDNQIKIHQVNDEKQWMLTMPKNIAMNSMMLRNMSNYEISNPNVLWPTEVIYENHEFVGFKTSSLAYVQPLRPLLASLENQAILNEDEKARRIALGLQIAKCWQAILNSNYFLLGQITNTTFYVDQQDHVFLMEAYRFALNTSSNYSYYRTPEQIMRPSLVANQQSDAYLFALLLFQVLTNDFPYECEVALSKADYELIFDRMVDGESIFNQDNQKAKDLKSVLKSYGNDIYNAFYHCFDVYGKTDYTQGRLSIQEWIEILTNYK